MLSDIYQVFCPQEVHSSKKGLATIEKRKDSKCASMYKQLMEEDGRHKDQRSYT